MIEKLKDISVYNPIRDHIRMNFETVLDDAERFTLIAEDLKSKNFNSNKSRVLIFVRSRKKAEEAVVKLKASLEDSMLDYSQKVDYYHAGLEGFEREEKYENFENGDIVILIATKAFGMGMDIKNIHFVYHLGPSSTFEDFLQEVGRAGRNKEKLEKAGFSSSNPIQAKCLLTNKDFGELKDLLQRSQMTWNHVKQISVSVKDYVKNFKAIEVNEEDAFALPLDLINQDIAYDENHCNETFFRVGLYWLEKLGRIKLGVYTPTHIPIRLLNSEGDFSKIKSIEDHTTLKKMFESLKKYKQLKFPNADLLMVGTGELKEMIDKNWSGTFYQILFMAQKAKLLIIERYIQLETTKLRNKELENWDSSTKSPTIESVFDLAYDLLRKTKLMDQTSFEGSDIDELIKNIAFDNINPAKIFWKEYKGSKNNEERSAEEIAERLRGDFLSKRAKFAFKLIAFLSKMRHKTNIVVEPDTKHPIITQLIYNGYKSQAEWKAELVELKEKLYKLVFFVKEKFIKQKVLKYNIVDLLVHLDLLEKDESFQSLVFMSKALGYLKGDGKFVPMGIELFFRDLTDISEQDSELIDSKVFNEFTESNQMKELRLITLESLSKVDHNKHDHFIKEYFKAADIGSLISLLEDHLEEYPDILKAYRTEALEKAKTGLRPQQRAVYEEELSSNIQVIAGPGTGKTHTLILRVARLIQEDKIKPENILVLAYNRAVVIELKDRLSKLFKELGYSKIIKRLKVFTFHGFCKYSLGQELNEDGFDGWVTKFIEITNSKPGLISQKLGPLRYVFVDEFQDITSERMDLLKIIANPKTANICVIGDPNQSIYGFQRAQEGGPMDPKSYYEEFDKEYKPVELNLSINHRSYPHILSSAEKILSLNQTKFEMPNLIAKKNPDFKEEYCEIIDFDNTKVKWKDKLDLLLDEKDSSGEKKHRQIAIMFRSNAEVSRAFNLLQDINPENIRLRIQGSSTSIYRTREFHHFINLYDKESDCRIKSTYLEDFKIDLGKTRKQYANWDEYLLNLFYCLILEFDKEIEEGSTYGDLVEFIKELSLKNDSQIGKIYFNNITTIIPESIMQEVVLTTMHKVKGMEYDAVIIPPSFVNFPQIDNESIPFIDLLEEERRLYYVAYTRAKHRLIVINHKRENALIQGERYVFPDDIINRIGVKLDEGIDKFKISWGAGDFGGGFFNFIKNSVEVGMPIILQKQIFNGFEFWNVFIDNNQVASLTGRPQGVSNDIVSIDGYRVSSIQVYTFNETVEYDLRQGTTLADRWTQIARERGFIYLIDFSGYGSPKKE